MEVNYPPEGHYRGLSWWQQIERREAASDLLALIHWVRGDERLTWWEEGSLTEIAGQLQRTHGTVSVSPNQREKIRQIMALLDEHPAVGEASRDECQGD